MIQYDVPLLVIGAGSIGERHIGVLQSLGYKNIHVYRQRLLPFRNIENSSVNSFTNWDEINHIKPYAAIICTPTSQHLPQAQECLHQEMHVLVEKPLADTTQAIDDLMSLAIEKNKLVQVGYMLRYHPLMKKLKSIISTQELGRLVSFSSIWAEYLPNWHPWEDYRTSYAARKDLGGGVALTLSHDLDIVNWLVGELPHQYHKIYNYHSDLAVDVEAGAAFLLSYPMGVTGVVQLNFYQKIPVRKYELVFSNALVTFDYFGNQIIIQTTENTTTIENKDFERNQLFEQQMIDFLQNSQNANLNLLTKQYIDESKIIIKMCQR